MKTTIQIPLLFTFLLLIPSLHTLAPTLKDLVQDPVYLYHDPSSIPFDSIKPEHINTIGVDAIKSETGDFNGDGINDLVVATLKYEGVYNFYVIFGTEEGLPEYSFKQKLDERDGFQIAAKDAGNFGVKDVGFIGDINGDGLADLLAVVHGSITNGDRRTYIIYGSNKKLPSIVDPMESTRTLFSDRYLDQKGNQNPLLRFAGVGDFNGDGVEDFVIANEEKMSVVFGSKSLSSKVASYASLEGVEPKELTITAVTFASTCFAAKVSRAGDFNGDGFADIMMSTKCENGQAAGPSKVYLIFGQKTFPESFPSNYLGSSNYPNSLILDGGVAGDFFGSRIEAIGDFNGDGRDDIMVSSMYFANTGNVKNDIGGTYIFYGQKDLSGNLPHGILDSRPELGVFIPNAGHSIAAIGDINKDKYSDILLTKDSSAYVIYGGPNISKQFSLDSINGKNGWSIYSNARIQDCVGLGDINGDQSPDFALTYGSSKYSIITKDLPRATVCYDAQYCFTPEASKYLDSNFCTLESPAPAPPVEKANDESSPNTPTPTEATVYSYNPATQGVYNKATEHIVSKDTMSASTAALCGTAIGAGISAMVFLLGGAVRKWYKEGNYVQLDEQTAGSIDWTLESCKVKIYEIEEAMNKKFKCYKCLLWGLLGFEILTIIHLFVDMDAFGAYFIARLTLHCFKAFAFGKAIEAYKKGGLEKQKRVVLRMKVLYGLGCIFLVLHTIALYQKVKPYWYLVETGLQFAGAVLFLAIFYIGTQLVVCLYAQKLLKLMLKREELREQLGNSRVDLQSREQESAASAV